MPIGGVVNLNKYVFFFFFESECLKSLLSFPSLFFFSPFFPVIPQESCSLERTEIYGTVRRIFLQKNSIYSGIIFAKKKKKKEFKITRKNAKESKAFKLSFELPPPNTTWLLQC